MKHYFKIPLPNSNVDVFFSCLNKENRTVNFVVVSKEGKIIPHPDTHKKETVQPYLLDDNFFTILGLIQVSKDYFKMVDDALNGSDESAKQNVV